MDVRFMSDEGIEQHPVEELAALLARDDGLVWVDIPVCDEPAARVLSEVFGFHPLAIQACIERNAVPRVRAYRDHVFVVLHAPELGKGGHVHYVELDQFIGPRYLVSVHGPLNPAVTQEASLRQTRGVLQRVEAGRLRPRSPFELSYAIVGSLAHRQGVQLERLATEVAALEQRVRGDLGDPVRVLEEMFLVRHELLSIRTIAAESGEVYTRMSALSRMIPPESPPLIQDLINRFERVRSMSDDEKEFAQGVIDFYQARTTTRMNIAMERLALIAAVLLPVTAIAS
ncbi:MAG TPA: magnesium transporter CorA family protein, partial [Actinomycetes bacterium]|nr:magnesium transporter CorA family protein [Actinomycetes bacterium]